MRKPIFNTLRSFYIWKLNGIAKLPIYDFQLKAFNSKQYFEYASYPVSSSERFETSIHLRPFDIELDMWMPLKLKIDGAAGLPIYDFLLVFSNNISPTSAYFLGFDGLKYEWPWAGLWKVTQWNDVAAYWVYWVPSVCGLFQRQRLTCRPHRSRKPRHRSPTMGELTSALMPGSRPPLIPAWQTSTRYGRPCPCPHYCIPCVSNSSSNTQILQCHCVKVWCFLVPHC